MTPDPGQQETAGRLVRAFDRDWAFCYDPAPEPDPARAAPAADPADFTAVSLPHTWQTWETTGRVHPFVADPAEEDNSYWWHGWGWYRKVFRLAAGPAGRRVFLELDGAQKFCRLYCNGQLVGEHAGGFASFSVELTGALRPGEENVIAVAVSARQKDDFGGIPPMNAGNWAFYGGLYRQARLVITGSLYIPFQGNAGHEGGTRVTTPEVSRERARVRVVTHLCNAGSRPRRVSVEQEIVDAARGRVAVFASAVTIAPGETAAVEQESPPVRRPRLWSPEDPYCYAVLTRVREDGQLLDHWETTLGFRWFRWDEAENALYLNDRRVRLNGMNRHQEYPWLGDAAPWWIHERELREIRYELGINFARWCHYPHDRRVYDWCDRHGIIVCEEVPNIKNLPFDPEHQRRQVLEMIRRDRNHPCIIMWSMGNETNCGADGRQARAADPTRLIHYRKVEGPNYEADHTHRQLDMENLLRCTVRGWWEAGAMDAGTAPLPADNVSGQVTGSEAWQHAAARKEDGSIRGRIDRDTVIWIYADHGADREYRHCPLRHVNPKGWVDVYRQPKAVYWLWQANRTGKLMVRARDYWWRAVHLGTCRDITVDSNGEEVELFVGERSFGVRRPGADNFYSVVFEQVPVSDAPLRVVARRGEETCESRTPLAGPPVALRLVSSHRSLPADRAAVALVTVDVVDRQGRAVIGARPPLHWECAGPGALAGPPEWTSDIDRRQACTGTMYIVTPVVMPVRAGCAPGTLTVRVSSPGLEPAAVTLAVREAPLPDAGGITELPAAAGDGRRRCRQREESLAGVDRVDCPQVWTDLSCPPDADRATVYARLHQVLQAAAGEAAARALAGPLTDRALAARGVLIADDINFYLRQWFFWPDGRRGEAPGGGKNDKGETRR